MSNRYSLHANALACVSIHCFILFSICVLRIIFVWIGSLSYKVVCVFFFFNASYINENSTPIGKRVYFFYDGKHKHQLLYAYRVLVYYSVIWNEFNDSPIIFYLKMYSHSFIGAFTYPGELMGGGGKGEINHLYWTYSHRLRNLIHN